MKSKLVLIRDALDRPLKRLVVKATQRRLYVVFPTDGTPDPRRAVGVLPGDVYAWDEAVHGRLVAAGGSAEAWEAEAPYLRKVSMADFSGKE